MAVTITNQSNVFEQNKNVAIILKQPMNSKIKKIQNNDFIFIFNENNLIGINILNFINYFKVEDGYHKITSEIQKYLLNNFPQYVKANDFESFIKIGKVIEIQQHPNLEKLKVLKVKFNSFEKQIITNVNSIELNNNYLFALDGATLATGTQIIESKVGNILSQGMIISYQSLGIDKEGVINCNNFNLDEEYSF